MFLADNVTLYFLVFLRMSGCIMPNPILGRKNLPVILNIGLCLLLTAILYPLVPAQNLRIPTFTVLFVCAVREMMLGFLLGYVINLFLAVIIIGGETVDMQTGFSMSKIYDPQSNAAIPLTATYLNAMFYFVFFAANGHLTLIRIFLELGIVVPYGDMAFSPNMFFNLTALFSHILIYAVKIALPVLTAEIVSELCVGLIIRVVPRIDVFVINIQLKLAVGFAVLWLVTPALSGFLEKLILIMFDNLRLMLKAFA